MAINSVRSNSLALLQGRTRRDSINHWDLELSHQLLHVDLLHDLMLDLLLNLPGVKN